MLKNKRKEWLPDCLYLAAVFLFLLCWSVVQPLNVSPDEHMRFQIVEYIMNHGTLPHGGNPEIRNELWGISYAFNPITPYMIGAIFGKVVSFFTASEMAVVIAARMINVIFGTAAAGIVLKTGKILFKRELAYLFSVLVAFLPQAMFIHSYLNADSMAVFSTAWIVLCWVKAVRRGWTPKLCMELGAALAVCALSYYNAYGFILCSVFFFVCSILCCEEKQWNFKKMFSLGILVAVVALVLAGWWFVRNGIIYDGDILGMRTSTEYAQMYAREDLKPSNRITPKSLGMDLKDMFLWIPGEWRYNWITTVAVSFVGTFGFLDIFMPKMWSVAYFAVFALGMAGVLLGLRKHFCIFDEKREVARRKEAGLTTIRITIKRKKNLRIKGIFNICMLISMVIPFILLVVYAYSSDFQAQGRYLMPMLVPFMYFLVCGFENLMEKFVKKEKVRIWLCRGMAVCYILSSVAVYLVVFLPNYV